MHCGQKGTTAFQHVAEQAAVLRTCTRVGPAGLHGATLCTGVQAVVVLRAVTAHRARSVIVGHRPYSGCMPDLVRTRVECAYIEVHPSRITVPELLRGSWHR